MDGATILIPSRGASLRNDFPQKSSCSLATVTFSLPSVDEDFSFFSNALRKELVEVHKKHSSFFFFAFSHDPMSNEKDTIFVRGSCHFLSK